MNPFDDRGKVPDQLTLRVGEVVPIKDGPLGGSEAVVERELPGYKRAILLLKTLSYQAKIVVDLGNIVNMRQVGMARADSSERTISLLSRTTVL